MRERPTGEELLAIARKVLLEELMPLLPSDRRYDTLMIANAMGIAARQLAHGNDFSRYESRELENLLGKTGTETAAKKEEGDPTELYRELCVRIRNGDFDPDTPEYEALQEFLYRVTVQRLKESAPKILEAAGLK
ncbi:MAG: hypothetical protein HOM07_06340 [Rhodospirillaceae bacterium]|jgi:hypothetical protein|nr:hypothetical protein [Rhodospirillaceae bacterium]MBT5457794.1 hypothetical protein [Rhodospirillaceae bacterium]